MTEKDRKDLARLEAEINALLDGELDAEATAELKAAAAEDSQLAQAIVEAWQLQKHMDGLRLEKAPATLTRKLRRIPREHRPSGGRAWFGLPRWSAAVGLASVAALALAMMMNAPESAPGNPEQAPEVASSTDRQRAERARQDLEVAFHYLDKAGLRVCEQIHEVLQHEIAAPVKDNLGKHIPYTEQSLKEKQA